MYNQELIDTVIADKFKIVRRIGGGSFGEIYLCLGPNGTEVHMSSNQLHFSLDSENRLLIIASSISCNHRLQQSLRRKSILVRSFGMNIKFIEN